MSEYEPITAELRAALDVDREFMRADGTVVAQTFCVDRDDFDRCCDAIDAVHAALERENAELRAILDNADENMHDGWVRKEEGKTISAYYVDVVPRFDWKLMALELEQFAEIVRGMAGDDE